MWPYFRICWNFEAWELRSTQSSSTIKGPWRSSHSADLPRGSVSVAQQSRCWGRLKVLLGVRAHFGFGLPPSVNITSNFPRRKMATWAEVTGSLVRAIEGCTQFEVMRWMCERKLWRLANVRNFSSMWIENLVCVWRALPVRCIEKCFCWQINAKLQGFFSSEKCQLRNINEWLIDLTWGNIFAAHYYTEKKNKRQHGNSRWSLVWYNWHLIAKKLPRGL